MRCDHWTQRRERGRFRSPALAHPCRHPARFRVRGNTDRDGIERVSMSGETPCGLHVRPYLMDNGDSVWQPWIIEPLDAPKSTAASEQEAAVEDR